MKKIIKTVFCPICGNRPKKAPFQVREHYWSIECDKCSTNSNVWIQTKTASGVSLMRGLMA